MKKATLYQKNYLPRFYFEKKKKPMFCKKNYLGRPFFFKKKKNLNLFEFHSHILLLTNCLNSTLPCFTPKKLLYYQI